MDPSPARWRKSSHSGDDADCVEVALAPDAAAVRDSKNPHGGRLTLPASAWQTFTTKIKQS